MEVLVLILPLTNCKMVKCPIKPAFVDHILWEICPTYLIKIWGEDAE